MSLGSLLFFFSLFFPHIKQTLFILLVLTGGKYHKRRRASSRSGRSNAEINHNIETLFLIYNPAPAFGPPLLILPFFQSPAKAREIMLLHRVACVYCVCIRSLCFLLRLFLAPHLRIPIQFFLCVYFRLFKFTRHICTHTHTHTQSTHKYK